MRAKLSRAQNCSRRIEDGILIVLMDIGNPHSDRPREGPVRVSRKKRRVVVQVVDVVFHAGMRSDKVACLRRIALRVHDELTQPCLAPYDFTHSGIRSIVPISEANVSRILTQTVADKHAHRRIVFEGKLGGLNVSSRGG